MRRFITILIIYFFVLSPFQNEVQAQQQYIMTQYMFNGLALNPAYAGSHESWSATLMSRHQWTGIEGAPTTQSLTLHGPISKVKGFSLGLLFVKDKFGAIELNNFYASSSYRIAFDQGKRHLAFGLQGGFSTFNVDLSNAHLIDLDDPALNDNNRRSFLPNFGTGIYYHGKKVFAGISIPYFLNNRLNQVNSDKTKQVRHYYINAGSIIVLNHNIKFKPSVLVRYVDKVPIDFDITSSFLLNDIIWLGVTYRLNDSFDFILELQFTDHFRLGYSFDLTTSELNTATSGSHEFVLNYRIKKKQHKVFNPRHF